MLVILILFHCLKTEISTCSYIIKVFIVNITDPCLRVFVSIFGGMMRTNLPENIVFNSAAGLVSINAEGNSLGEKVLIGKAKSNYNCKHFGDNGWYVSKLPKEAFEAVDSLQEEMQCVPFRQRRVWNQVFNTLQNTSDYHEKLKQVKLSMDGAAVDTDSGRIQIFINETESKQLKAKAEKVGKILKYRVLEDLKKKNEEEEEEKKQKQSLSNKGEKEEKKKKKKQKQSLSNMFLTALETEPPVMNPSTGTLDWIPNQLLHSDTDPNKGIYWEPDQFIGLVATNPGTTYIRVITGSHHLDNNDFGKRKYVHVIALQQYEYFVAKPTLIHGGSTNKPYKNEDQGCGCDDGCAATMIRRSTASADTIGGSPSSSSAVEQFSDLERYRNTRLHFYYKIPKSATKQTHFLVDKQAAHFQIIDYSARDMAHVRSGRKSKKRLNLRSADDVVCKRRRVHRRTQSPQSSLSPDQHQNVGIEVIPLYDDLT